MFWLGFWIVVIGYFVIGYTRVPVYFKMFYDKDRKEFSIIHTVEQSRKEAFWCAFFLMLIWPFYEIGKQFQNRAISSLTREEREQEEFEKAQRIVKEYTARKEREEREKFERELKD